MGVPPPPGVINHVAPSSPQALYNPTPPFNHNTTLPNHHLPTPILHSQLTNSTNLLFHVPQSAIPNLDSQLRNWMTECNSSHFLLHNQARCSPSKLFSNCESAQYGSPMPNQSNYNLNLPPSLEDDAASSVPTTLPFSPVTPDHLKNLGNQIFAGLNFSMDESLNQEKDKQENLVVSTGNDVVNRNYNDLLQNVVESSSSIITTPLEEERDSYNANDGGIDLNKTPQQKPPKRRKHRPKVIKEGKPKGTAKTATPKNTATKANPGEKRKYVRKKNLKESETQHADIMKETTDPDTGPVATSCRRALNFDLEDESLGAVIGQQEEMQQRYKRTFNLNLVSQIPVVDSSTNNGCPAQSNILIGQQNGLPVQDQQPRTICNHSPSLNQIPFDHISVPERQPVAASLSPRIDIHRENSNVTARNLDARILYPCQNSGKYGNTPIEQYIYAKGNGQTVFQTKTNRENLGRTRQSICPSSPESAPEILSSSKRARGSKREYHHDIKQIPHAVYPRYHHDIKQIPHAVYPMGPSSLFQDLIDGHYRNGSIPASGCSKTCKKKKIENGLLTNKNGDPSGVTAVKDGSRQVQTKSMNDVNGNGFTSRMNCSILNSDFGSNNMARRQNCGVNKVTSDWYAQPMAFGHNWSKQYISFEQQSDMEKVGEPYRLNLVHDLASLTASEKLNLLPAPPGKALKQEVRLLPKTCANVSARGNEKPAQSKSVSSGMWVLPGPRKAVYDYQQNSAKRGGLPIKQICPISMDEVIHRFRGITLNERGEAKEQDKMAIVPYEQDGTVVPYEDFELIKKCKIRPKVDPDPETERTWKVLMGKEGSDGLEGIDKENEKWWEEERRVFQGRADSFIAQMHRVQGDRRFSKWKGSVVDSVIGVFLTQNVSDHLSSSAFMSLAARFPLKSNNNRTCNMDGTNVMVEEPEVCVQSPNGAIQWHERVLRNPLYSQSSKTVHESTERQRESEISGIEKTCLLQARSRLEEEVLSPQDSFSSSILQGNGGIRSSSGSNSEVEYPTSGCKTNQDHGSTNFLQMGNTTSFEDFYRCINQRSLYQEEYGHRQKSRLESIDNLNTSLTFTQLLNFEDPQNQVSLVTASNYQQQHKTSYSDLLEVKGSEIYSGESISSSPSTVSGFPKANYTSRRYGQLAESVRETIVQQNGLPTVGPLSKHSVQQKNVFQPGSQARYNQPCCHHERKKTFHHESTLTTEAVNLTEACAKGQKRSMQHAPYAPELSEKTVDIEERISVMGKEIPLENKSIEPNSGKQSQGISASKASGLENLNISKSRKGKADAEKMSPIDWDGLRKQVPGNGRKKERTADTMDSLDYEALRTADVKDISDAIKERGMNNMLAERMKEFLNRLVRDHGKIDLEWLRDVPPDKAKDYLLSIRGLGLKSVECVRLLTLHHLAFPVDTNVGRIAVRLGWVPLQPLPESLHLHLLELYPILESVQKYIWPRLCKLDQRTLYELHYQMITFGKVFCTKKKPNCNACPMRGDCRHFASAFASARLALPGPEDKRIVTSTVPITAEQNPGVVIHPVLLPPPEENSLTEAGREVGKCVPIIEEPATPEQEYTEIEESDIEDTFFDGPNEIPKIELNIEEFTLNLQNYMQENMELQEGDMSKALVTLNPEAASIPTPKLKNPSRLRTEHQVYQLPDSHPLLEGMDVREPDDPSPYLLAIWTPGETANSIQPLEKRCESQESGKICNDAMCFSCNSAKEVNSQTVRGTILIPCRTAMRGSFPLNGTYFQVNEVFADHESSVHPIDVPREWIWNLPRRTVYFGTSVTTIFKGLSTEGIQYCFWRGFVCVRGFDKKLRAPRPLTTRLHLAASKLAKTRNENRER